MSLDEQGFLSPDLERLRLQIREKYAPAFALVELANGLIQNFKYKLEVPQSDDQKMLATCLLIKVANDIQASVLLAERGLVSQAASLVRVAVDGLILMAKTCKELDFSNQYRALGRKSQRVRLNAIINNPAPGLDSLRGIAPDLLNKLGDEDELEIPRKTIEKWAKEVGLGTLYDATYRLFSDDVHSGPASLGRYLLTDESDNPIEFTWGPDAEPDPRVVLVEAARVLLGCINLMKNLFNLADIDGRHRQLVAEFEILAKSLT